MNEKQLLQASRDYENNCKQNINQEQETSDGCQQEKAKNAEQRGSASLNVPQGANKVLVGQVTGAEFAAAQATFAIGVLKQEALGQLNYNRSASLRLAGHYKRTKDQEQAGEACKRQASGTNMAMPLMTRDAAQMGRGSVNVCEGRRMMMDGRGQMMSGRGQMMMGGRQHMMLSGGGQMMGGQIMGGPMMGQMMGRGRGPLMGPMIGRADMSWAGMRWDPK